MSFFFRNFPTVEYDIEHDGGKATITDFTLRYKILAALKDRAAVYYEYDIQDGERADIIADKYYGNSTYEWLVFLANDIIDPQFDWPLSQRNFESYIKSKYGNTQVAYQQIHHYEWIIRPQSILDGNISPEYAVEVSLAKYNTLAPSARRVVYAYDYENTLNERKRQIRLIDKVYLSNIISEIQNVFE